MDEGRFPPGQTPLHLMSPDQLIRFGVLDGNARRAWHYIQSEGLSAMIQSRVSRRDPAVGASELRCVLLPDLSSRFPPFIQLPSLSPETVAAHSPISQSASWIDSPETSPVVPGYIEGAYIEPPFVSAQPVSWPDPLNILSYGQISVCLPCDL